ncbi:MAG: caspase family protein [Reichenbachiella sp.]
MIKYSLTTSLIFLFTITHLFAQNYPLEIVIQGGPNGADHFQISPDNKLVSTWTDNFVHIWDLASGKRLRTIEFGESVKVGLFIPETTSLVVGGNSSTVSIFDYVTGKKVVDLPELNNWVDCGVVSKKGKYIAIGIGNKEKGITVFDAKTYQVVRTFNQIKSVRSIDIDATQTFVAYSGDYNRTACIANIETGEELILPVLEANSRDESVKVVKFNADGKYLITHGGEEIIGKNYTTFIKIWNVTDGAFVKPIKMDEQTPDPSNSNINVLSDPDQILIGNNIWSIGQGKKLRVPIEGGGSQYYCEVSDDGKYFLGKINKVPTIFDLRKGSEIVQYKNHAAAIDNMAISPDGKLIALKSRGVANIWDLTAAKKKYAFDDLYNYGSGIAFNGSSDILYLEGGETNTNLMARSMSSGQLIWINEKKRGYGNKFISINDETIYTLDGEGTSVARWNTKTGQRIFNYGNHDHYPGESSKPSCQGPEGKIIKTALDDEKNTIDIYSRKGEWITIDANSGAQISVDTFNLKNNKLWKTPVKGKYAYVGRGQAAHPKIMNLSDSSVREHGAPVWGGGVFTWTNNGEYRMQAQTDHSIKVWDSKNNYPIHSLQHQDEVNAVTLSNDDRFLFSISEDATLKQWDYKNGKELATYISIGTGDFVILTPEKYYTASKGAAAGVSFVKGLEVFDFENFDLIFNRPDIVLKRIGGNQRLIDSYYKAYLKRLKKMGFEERNISTDMHLPKMEVLTENFPVDTDQETLTVDIKAFDTKYNLDRINIYVNSVPILGVKGKSIKDQSVSEYAETFEIPLSSGQNNIQFSTHNQNGMESLKKMVSIFCNVKRPINTYVVSIGISDYQDDEYDLNYAAKDANDIATKFGTDASKVFSITDGNAVKEKILSIKSELMKSKVDDRVVLFVAGHGLLDDNLDYFIGMHDVDFENPAARGLPYEQLEGLLDGIPARKKLMFIDACHSGEVDKDDAVLTASSETSAGTIQARGFAKVASKSESLGLENSFQLMQELFADLRKGTGAVVISSASGAEYALESDAWQNGVFTYSILEGLEDRKCDTDNNGSVEVSELKDYVFDRVAELTNGKQHPTSRRENLEHDFVVW